MFDRLPELLRRLRLDRGLTQDELSRAAEVSMGHVSRIEAGHHDPHLDTLSRILEALGVTSFDDFCRLYRDLKRELDPYEAPAEPMSPKDETEDLGHGEQAGAELAARLRPWLKALPADANAAQLDFPSHVVYVLPKPRA